MTFLLITPQDCFERQREHVLNAERLLLHALRFDFNVDHPYKHILSLAKRAFEELQFTQNFSRNLTQVAWNFANDSLRTTLCLQFTARAIAAAVLHLGEFRRLLFHEASDITLMLIRSNSFEALADNGKCSKE